MNYFGGFLSPRQAVLGCAASALIAVASVSGFGQEAESPDTPKLPSETVSKQTAHTFVETVLKAEAETETEEPAKIAVKKSEKIFAEVALEKELSAETERQSDQSQQDDDTMEGVMGKRPTGKARIGGHVGFVLPLVARRSNSTALPIVDNFTIGFPVGLTVRTNSPVAFDFEFIPTINTPGRNNFFLTIHPGILYGFKKKYAAGVRAAYDVGNGSYGFTPLIARGFKINEKLGFFIEGDFPIRWNRRETGGRFASGAFGAHFGLAF